MEPAAKRRRLAPKVPDAPTQQATSSPGQATPEQPQSSGQAQQYVPVDHAGQQPQIAGQAPAAPAVPPVADRHDFEAFARHLQDAAIRIYRQACQSSYKDVTVLMLRWEEDTTVEPELLALEKVFQERYNYKTDVWTIPTCPNPSIKLGVHMSTILHDARPDHLLIVYYAGHGYVDPDDQLYWACNTSDDAAKLKWNSVRCLFEDAQSDMLVLLDSCCASDASLDTGTSRKQVIAAYTLEQSQLQPSARSFTATLVECLTRLSEGRPYSVQRLYEHILAQRQVDAALAQKANGDTKPERAPVCLTLSSGSNQNLVLAPLGPSSQVRPSNGEVKAQSPKPTLEEQIIKPGSVLDLTFDEARVLVCTTFVGDASPDMAYFKQWLHNTPPLGARIEVEGMFIGPPTMLLISMPQSIWNVVQHDKVCCFLGYINSHNMIHLYKQLVGSTPIPTLSPQEVEDGRILLEAREAAANSPSLIRRDTGNYPVLPPDTPIKTDTNGREALPVNGQLETQTPARSALPHGSPNGHVQDTAVEDSAEMQEAAEQLKALSHVRHMSDEHSGTLEIQQTPVTANREGRHPLRDSRAISQNSDGNFDFTISAKIKDTQARKPLKPKEKTSTPKQETRCSMCAHAPFKDSSSLRKHIAAAHTRPFPCAFSFAGCSSTFGSKNEWKRHIASQHLCLQYYRCSSCTNTVAEGKGNEFNRKDLFTQHLRRMHAPFAVKKSLKQIDQRVQLEWDNHLREMQQSCLVTRRLPPSKSACPKPECQTVFEGAGSWDEWTEHVGRHMEKGEAQRMGVDRLLAEWALEEGIIEPKGNGEYKLCSQPGTNGSNASQNGGGGSSNNNNTNHSFISDAGKDDDDPSTAAALSGSSSEHMDVDVD